MSKVYKSHDVIRDPIKDLAAQAAESYLECNDISTDWSTRYLYKKDSPAYRALGQVSVEVYPENIEDDEDGESRAGVTVEISSSKDMSAAYYFIESGQEPLLTSGDDTSPEFHSKIDALYDAVHGMTRRALVQASRNRIKRDAEESMKKNIRELSKPPVASPVEFGEFDDVLWSSKDETLGLLKDALTAHDIKMVARQELREDDAPYYISEPFTAGESYRSHVLMLHNEEDALVPRVYYRSGSQNVWRWMPARAGAWYSKGQSEYALDVPVTVQKTLDGILGSYARGKDIQMANDQEGFADILRLVIPHFAEDEQLEAMQLPLANHFTNLNIDSDLACPKGYGDYYDKPAYDALAPAAPNFSAKVDSWESDSELYGHVWNEVFHSNDGTIVYQMAHSAEGMAWVAHVEPKDMILRPTLNSDTYINAGYVLETPAYDYESVLEYDFRKGPMINYGHAKLNYFDFFTMGIANSPVIDLYYKTIPEEHFPWKVAFKGVPNWPGMRSVLQERANDSMSDYYYSRNYLSPHYNELTAALAAAAAVLPEHQTITDTFNKLEQMLYGISRHMRSDDFTPPLTTTESAGDTVTDTLTPDDGGIFSIEPFNSPAIVGKLELRRQLGYKEVDRVAEVHNPDLTRVYLHSEAYSDAPFVYEFTPEGVMGISPKLSGAN